MAGLLGAGVWFLIAEAVSFRRILHALGRASPGWLVAAFVAALAGYVGYALLYQSLAALNQGPRPSLPLTLRLAVAIFAASVLATAAGRLGGEYWSLRRLGERPPQAWSRVLALNIAGWAILAGLALLGSLMLLAGVGPGVPLAAKLAWLLALPACAIPARYLSAERRRPLWEDRGGRIRRTLAAALRGLVLVRLLPRRPKLHGRALGGGLIYWGAELLTVWFALRAFGIDLGPGALVVGYATGYVSTMLPLPAGGAGSVDAASTFALTMVGVPLGPALLATLVQRLCTYWLPLVVALLGVRFLRRLPRELAAVDHGRASDTDRTQMVGAVS